MPDMGKSLSADHLLELRKAREIWILDWRQEQLALADDDLSFGDGGFGNDRYQKQIMFQQAKRWTAKLGGLRYERPD